jgi:hypothetical protein
LTGSRRAGLFEDFLLGGSENLLKLGLGLFFQGVELLLLGRRELELVGDELWQEVESGGWCGLSPGAAGKAARPAGEASWSTGPAATLRRGAIGIVGCQGSHGDCRRDENAQPKNAHLKTLHGALLFSGLRGKNRPPYALMNAAPLLFIAGAGSVPTIWARTG